MSEASKEEGHVRLDELELGELLPCPFCGGEAEVFEFDATDEEDPNAGGSVVQCKKCGASSPVHFDRKEHLESSWNERVPSSGDQKDDVIEECALALDAIAFHRKAADDSARGLVDAQPYEQSARTIRALKSVPSL